MDYTRESEVNFVYLPSYGVETSIYRGIGSGKLFRIDPDMLSYRIYVVTNEGTVVGTIHTVKHVSCGYTRIS